MCFFFVFFWGGGGGCSIGTIRTTILTLSMTFVYLLFRVVGCFVPCLLSWLGWVEFSARGCTFLACFLCVCGGGGGVWLLIFLRRG